MIQNMHFRVFLGFPRWVCEWEAVTVYGRISYSAYIIHCALIRLRMGITRWPTYNSEGILVTDQIECIVCLKS